MNRYRMYRDSDRARIKSLLAAGVSLDYIARTAYGISVRKLAGMTAGSKSLLVAENRANQDEKPKSSAKVAGR